ncbi:MAG TPA: 3-deoxy-D-manno-octulosonic acid kinase [Gammaproteobacteria bacterium]|nr:3-deoxy-D-manno-octulosonic acid kinase [Gammaproteobacteria bacterium]
MSSGASLSGQFTFYKADSECILYDAELVADEIRAEPRRLFLVGSGIIQHAQKPAGEGGGIGRARVQYFHCGDMNCVLKHYYRGGMVARLLKDLYFGRNCENSRAFREYRLLKKMQDMELPVPRAVAARVIRGLLFHRADLVTEEIEDVQTLSDVLSQRALDADAWRSVGYCIRRFHDAGVYHADLNARNILLGQKGEVFLIDFDNSAIRSDGNWRDANLARLQRSLNKFRRLQQGFNFSAGNWQALLAGYKGGG